MAILNKIRQRSLILILVIALALFSFVIGDIFKNSSSFGNAQDVVATINGEDINRMEFQQKVKSYQDQSGGRQTSTQAMNVIYDQEMRRIIMNSEFESLGLGVEKDEMRDLLKTSLATYPEFQDENGVFDVNRLNAFIANLKDLNGQAAPLNGRMVNFENWTTFENNLAKNATQQSYFNLVKAGVGATLAEAEAQYLAENQTLNLRYVQVPYTSIADSLVKVSKSDIKDYIAKHEADFKVDATRELVYVEFKEAPSKADEDAIQASLLALKNDQPEYNPNTKNTDTIAGFNNTKNVAEFINSYSDIKFNDTFLRAAELPATSKDSLMALSVGNYYGPYKEGEYYKLTKLVETKQMPDSVKVRHILIPFVGGERAAADVTKTPQEAKATADSILAVLKTNRSKFKSLLDLSSDKASNENDGIIEFAYNAGMAPEFKAFAFNNKTGDIDVVGTSFGYHIIEVLNQKDYSKTYQFATLARRIEPSEQTLQTVFNQVSNFEIAAKNQDFTALAKEKELALKPITFKALDENIPGLGSQREIVRWAFEDDTNVGDFKRFEVAGFGFVVAKVVEKNEDGLMNVEDASVTALPEIRKAKKAEMIRSKIKATSVDEIAKNQGQSVLSASAVSLKNTTLSGAGVEPRVIGTAFGLAQGATSKPIEGNKGVYVVEVTKINEATKLDNYTAILNRLSAARLNGVENKVYEALKNAADVEDNRAKTVY